MSNSRSKVDAKCVSFGRVGTVAVGKALNAHPDLYFPSWDKDLQRIINNQIQLSPDDSQLNCLTLHHQRLLDPSGSHYLAAVTEQPAAKLVHLVRDPSSHIIGWYNHIVESAFLGSSNWAAPGSFDDFIDVSTEVFPTFKNDMIAELFYPGAKEIKLVEFNQLQPSQFEATINGIQTFLEVETEPVLYTALQNDLTAKLLKRGMTLTLNGESIKLTMVQESSAQPCMLLDNVMYIDGVGALMETRAPSLRPVDGRIYVGVKSHIELKDSTLAILKKHQQEIFIPAIQGWVKSAEIFAQQLSELRISALTGKQKARFKSLIGQDMQAFIRRYPQLQGVWQPL